MLVVNRFRVLAAEGDVFRADLEAFHGMLAGSAGYVDGAIGRNIDEPELWALTTRWVNVGSYRRALSPYDVRGAAMALQAHAVNEPSAYEVVEPGAELNLPGSRGSSA